MAHLVALLPATFLTALAVLTVVGGLILYGGLLAVAMQAARDEAGEP